MISATPIRKIAHLFEVAGVFLRLGVTAFGGPAAHIALMEQEVVVERGWISRKEFHDLLEVVNLIPGPKSAEMAIGIGYRRAGWPGLLVGGVCFILPALLIVSTIAWAYVKFGKLPQAEGLLYGVKPVAIAVMAQAIWFLGRMTVKTMLLAVVGAGALGLSAFAVNPLLILAAGGLLTLIIRAATRPKGAVAGFAPVYGAASGFRLLSTAGTMSPVSFWPLVLFFLKVGFVMFGGGYVMLVFLRADLVQHHQWLTEGQLLDAVAVGQFTPGPFVSAVAFIGYVLYGTPGALGATVAIFLPTFVLVAVVGPLAARLRQSQLAVAFLDGVNVAALGMLAVVTWQLAGTALVDWLTVSFAVAAVVWMLCFRVNSTWLILAGAALGLARYVLSTGPGP